MADVIALCGIDGTGKSTQAALLQQRLHEVGLETRVLWCRWDPFLARPAIRLLDRLTATRAITGTSREANAADQSSVRRELRRRFLSSAFVRVAWRALMVLDYGLQVAPRLTLARRSAQVVIADRYRHDVLVDLSVGGTLEDAPSLLRWLMPEPDLLIVLDVAEDLALERKPDSPDLTYLEHRRALYQQLAKKTTGAMLVDASAPAEVVNSRLVHAVLDHIDPAGVR